MSNIFFNSWQHCRAKVLFTAFILINLGAIAQNITVSGTVSAKEDSSPLPGANVLAKQLNIGVVTDFDGNYSITVPQGTVLEFSYAGLLSENVKANSQTINVSLENNPVTLNETVVIGYGVQKKKEVTGAVVQVKAEDIQSFVTADISSALEGQIAGVSVSSQNGEPGSSPGILIRGVSSLTGSNDPLYVVDGVPQAGDPGLNPNEIETVDVLKDAASASIYGTRAAGGVILITTKKGVAGKARISFNALTGVSVVSREADLLNTREQVFVNLNSPETVGGRATNLQTSLNNNTDLRDLVVRDPAITTQYGLNLGGGSTDLTYSFTLGYFQQEGSVINSELTRYNARSNTQLTKGKFKLRTNLGLTIDDRIRPATNVFARASTQRPFLPFLSSDQTVFQEDDRVLRNNIRTVLGVTRQVNEIARTRFDASLNASYEINDALEVTTLLGTVFNNESQRVTTPFFQILNENNILDNGNLRSRIAEIRNERTLINFNVGLNYIKKFGNHNLTLNANFSTEQDNILAIGASGSDFAFEIPNAPINLSNTTENFAVTSFQSLPDINGNIQPDQKVRRIGSLARALYNYDERYLFSASIRRDASNLFADGERVGYFPSASIGWNVSEESFWKGIKSTITTLKLRASLGTTGNDRIPANSFEPVFNAGFDTAFVTGGTPVFGNGFAQRSLNNEDLKWEVTVQRNFGVDLRLFKKIDISADYYFTEIDDLLFNVPNPNSAGFGGSFRNDFRNQRLTVQNIGSLENQGFELSLRYRDNIGKLKWNILGTFTTNENEVKTLAPGLQSFLLETTFIQGDPNSQGIALLQGREAGAFFLLPTDGILRTQAEVDTYNATFNREDQIGDLRYVDANGNGVVVDDQADRVYSGSGTPDYEVGLNLRLDYKNFFLSTNWVGAFGGEIINGSRGVAISQLRSRDLLGQFIPGVNEDTDIPTFRGTSRTHQNFRGDTDFFVEDGDYVRLRTAQIGYNLPKEYISKIGLNSASLFVNAQNILTITDYSGLDPAVRGNQIQFIGIDRGNSPTVATYNLGFRLNF